MSSTINAPICVVCNAAAGQAGRALDTRQRLEELFGNDVSFIETRDALHAKEAAQRAAEDARMIVAAGGDGTINVVINALMECPVRPPLGLIPLGTGNNLCRTMGVPLDLPAAFQTLRSPRRVTIDLAKARSGGKLQYFSCVASGGNSHRVIEHLRNEDKSTWGPWCYLRSALPVMADLRAYRTTIEHDGGELNLPLWNVLVANGALAAGGLEVAPRARMDDGLLDVILIEDGTPLDLATLSAEFFLGDYLEDDRVTYLRTRKLRVESEPELRFLADGEMLEGQPFEFEAVSRALEIVVP